MGLAPVARSTHRREPTGEERAHLRSRLHADMRCSRAITADRRPRTRAESGNPGTASGTLSSMNDASGGVGRRVLVTGMAGSGKSTFSRALSAKTGLPLIYLDLHYWKPGWVKPS